MPNSSSTRLWVFLVLALLAALALAFWWFGRKPSSAPAPSSATASQSPATSQSTPSGQTASTAANDPRPALTRALALSDPRQRAREFGELLQAWIARDLEGALAYLRTLPRGPEYSQALIMVLDALARRDPERALQLAAELAVTREDRIIYNILFDRFARESVPTAIQRLALVPAGEARENALRALTDAWVSADYAAALAWARSLADAGDRRIAIESALVDIAQREPLVVLELAPQNLEGASLERVLATALRKLNETDPTRAASLLSLLPAGGDPHTLAAIEIARTWVTRDAPAALVWLDTLPAGRARDLALGNLLQVWGQQAPDLAGRHVVQLSPGATLNHVAPVLAATLAQSDPQNAIAWAGTLGSDPARSASLVAIASTWAQRDPAAALAWAITLPADSTRDTAIANAHANWRLQDASAASTWLDSAKLPPDVKFRLRQ